MTEGGQPFFSSRVRRIFENFVTLARILDLGLHENEDLRHRTGHKKAQVVL